MTISFWRDVSVVLLVVEALIFALVPLVVLYFTNKGFRRLRSLLQPLFPQIYLEKIFQFLYILLLQHHILFLLKMHRLQLNS